MMSDLFALMPAALCTLRRCPTSCCGLGDHLRRESHEDGDKLISIAGATFDVHRRGTRVPFLKAHHWRQNQQAGKTRCNHLSPQRLPDIWYWNAAVACSVEVVCSMSFAPDFRWFSGQWLRLFIFPFFDMPRRW